MKTCFRCLAEKPLSEFYVHPQMRDGHLNKCKDCACRDIAQHRQANAEEYRKRDRVRAQFPQNVASRKRYAHTAEGRAAMRKGTDSYIANNPDRRRAHSAVSNALRAGRLLKQPCVQCGSDRVHGHHEDYSRPLDVVWLCPACHSQLHKKRRGH